MGRPTYRVIPHGITAADVGLFHLHVDTQFAKEDLDVVLPTHRLEELARGGFVGRSAPSHYSIMGYILRPRELEEVTAPAIAARMKGRASMPRSSSPPDRSAAGPWDWSRESSKRRASRPYRCR